jgi:hypothetical protein
VTTARNIVIICAAVAAIVFIGVAVTEMNYVSGHPYAYGPAKVIAWAAGGGIALSVRSASSDSCWSSDRSPELVE